MTIAAFDHVAIPIENVKEMLRFYQKLGFVVNDSSAPFYSIHFGSQRINLHGPEVWQSASFTLRGPAAKPGCGDFCFVWEGSLQSIIEHLRERSIPIIEGPVERSGGRKLGTLSGMSVYVRDPESNLLEFMVYA